MGTGAVHLHQVASTVHCLNQCCGFGSGLDPNPGGQKNGKSSEILFLELLDDFFWGLKASPVAWMSCKEANCNFKFSQLYFFCSTVVVNTDVLHLFFV
jgi:hypothetical protein